MCSVMCFNRLGYSQQLFELDNHFCSHLQLKKLRPRAGLRGDADFLSGS